MSKRIDIPKRLIYTCNCGSVDKAHLRDPQAREYVGAKNLWKQIKRETGISEGHFPNGDKGFVTLYKQDMGSSLIKVGKITREYLVKYGLSETKKKSIALTIFQEVSVAFEKNQAGFPWSFISDSGFSQEDLVSNLLGFYLAVNGYDEMYIMQLCKSVSKEASFEVWDKDGAVGKNKNHECKGTPVFPSVFQTIQPAIKGVDFIEWG